MKHLLSLLIVLCLLPIACIAQAEDIPVSYQGEGVLSSGARWQAQVQVYGSEIQSVDTLTIKDLNLGRTPEDEIDIYLFLPEGSQIERRTFWTQEEVGFNIDEGYPYGGYTLSICPGSLTFRGPRYERLQNYTSYGGRFLEDAFGIEFPDSLPFLAPDAAQAACLPMMEALHMEFGDAVDIKAYTLEVIERLCSTMRWESVTIPNNPSSSELEAILKAEKTQEDAFYTFTIPQLINDIRISHWNRPISHFRYQAGNQPGGLTVMVDAQGAIQQFDTGAWLDMQSARVKETHTPISYEEALHTALASADKVFYPDGAPEGGAEIWVAEICLEYMLEPERATQNSIYTVIPVWSFYLDIHEKHEAATSTLGLIDLKGFEYIIAVDARNGKVIAN